LTPEMKAHKWKKGQPSPNASGRPKKKPITEAYEVLCNKKLPAALRIVEFGKKAKIDLGENATFADWLAVGLMQSARRGNPSAAAEIADRIEGKVPKPVDMEVTHKDELTGRTRDARVLRREWTMAGAIWRS